MTLLDWFLTELSGLSQVFLICGNHDSPERLAFGGRLMLHSGIHTAPLYSGRVEPILLQDAHGQVAVYLLPFLKPAHVRRFFPDSDTSSYTAALETAPFSPSSATVTDFSCRASEKEYFSGDPQ